MANTLKGKKIVLGITGSIAAYKACYIIRGLIKEGAEVQVVITPVFKINDPDFACIFPSGNFLRFIITALD